MTGNIPSSCYVNTRKNILIKDVEDYIDEIPYSYFSKAAVRIFDKIYNGRYGVLPSSISLD